MKVVLDASSKQPITLEGEDEEAIFDQWNKLPWFAELSGPEFASRLVSFYGLDDTRYVAEPVELPVDDAELLDKIVEAASPGTLVVERSTGDLSSFTDRVADAVAGLSSRRTV